MVARLCETVGLNEVRSVRLNKVVRGASKAERVAGERKKETRKKKKVVAAAAAKPTWEPIAIRAKSTKHI
ncbi:hypothetical protein CFP56_022282 [Quercus suber]|uniref:Uncharacterized protein n=1 Tax=Quercus suber TaxID=58331 RepID=A0AAW0KBC5_QUESU